MQAFTINNKNKKRLVVSLFQVEGVKKNSLLTRKIEKLVGMSASFGKAAATWFIRKKQTTCINGWHTLFIQQD